MEQWLINRDISTGTYVIVHGGHCHSVEWTVSGSQMLELHASPTLCVVWLEALCRNVCIYVCIRIRICNRTFTRLSFAAPAHYNFVCNGLRIVNMSETAVSAVWHRVSCLCKDTLQRGLLQQNNRV